MPSFHDHVGNLLPGFFPRQVTVFNPGSGLLDCTFKQLTGFSCPGCGLQRSAKALLQADFLESLRLYPALLPFLASAGLLLASVVRPWPPLRKWGFRGAIFSAVLVIGHWLFLLFSEIFGAFPG